MMEKWSLDPEEREGRDLEEVTLEIDMTGGRDLMVVTSPTARAETQALIFEALGRHRPDELLFGRPSDRFVYVAYEDDGEWVGVLQDPPYAVFGDSLVDLEDQFLQRLVHDRNVEVDAVRFFK